MLYYDQKYVEEKNTSTTCAFPKAVAGKNKYNADVSSNIQ
jgi:hypothetical protein